MFLRVFDRALINVRHIVEVTQWGSYITFVLVTGEKRNARFENEEAARKEFESVVKELGNAKD